MRRVLPLPGDAEMVVRGNAAVQAIAGSLLAVGVVPRAAALVLAGSLVPTTIAGHGFWSVDEEPARTLPRVQFQKNLAMIGGLLFAALDRPAFELNLDRIAGLRHDGVAELGVAHRRAR